MNTLNVRMVSDGGRTYAIETKQYDKLENILLHARNEMTSPCIYHMLSWVHDAETFRDSKRDLIKLFKRKLRKQYKSLKQEVPDTLIAYSVEFKETDIDEIKNHNTFEDRRMSLTVGEKLPFLHLHFYIIADCKKCRPDAFVKYAKDALDEIPGLSKARYFPSISGDIYKKVKDDPDDVFRRLLYIGKMNQKTPEIPYRETFGASQIKNKL